MQNIILSVKSVQTETPSYSLNNITQISGYRYGHYSTQYNHQMHTIPGNYLII